MRESILSTLALSSMTSKITYLEEGDHALLTRSGAEIFDRSGRRVEREARAVSVESALVDRGRRPFEWQDGDVEWARSPEPRERVTRTFCGT